MSRQQRLHDILFAQFNPIYLTVENESSNHSVPAGSETHFKIVIVSERFNLSTRIARHRMVNASIKHELANGLHALSMHLFTAEEWQHKKETVPASPACQGGSRSQ